MKSEFLTLGYQPADAGKEERFGFECPKRPGEMCSGLLIRGRGNDAPNRSWIWNGNRERPTFTPSINCGQCGSHGYVIDGAWRDA